jgi:CAI-1 autoinducer synthase
MLAIKPETRHSYTRETREPLFLTERVGAFYNLRLDPSWNGEALVKGRTPMPGAVLLMSNDYLSLSRYPAILAAQVEEIQRNGRGVLMSDVFRNGNGEEPQGAFEKALARHMGAEDAVLCQSGWCANVGLVQSIADPRTPVYIDMLAHMSLWEGIHSAGAQARPFKHNDPESLERLVERHGPGIIVVDAVYSTIGSVAPLPELCRIAEAHGCVLVVDESHSLGVFGSKGEGLVASLGLAQRVHFQTASLSKAFCSRGGIVTGSARNLKYFRYESRPAIFSSGLLSHEVAGFMATLQVIREENQRRIKLMWNANYLRGRLDELGYNVEDSQSQIIALVPGEEYRTKTLRDALEARGVFGSVFCAPATPKHKSLVRLSVNASLGEEELGTIVRVCREIQEEVGMADWASTRRRIRQSPNSNAA